VYEGFKFKRRLSKIHKRKLEEVYKYSSLRVRNRAHQTWLIRQGFFFGVSPGRSYQEALASQLNDVSQGPALGWRRGHLSDFLKDIITLQYTVFLGRVHHWREQFGAREERT
jgi:hypothetical protein